MTIGMVAFSVVASVFSGSLGVVATLWWQSWAGKKEQKLQIFKTLMANRGQIVDESNVKALNLIDIVFYNDKKVRECFKNFVLAAAKVPYSAQDLILKYLRLVESIAEDMGYKDVDWTRINDCIYQPQGLVERKREEELLRKASLQNQMALVNQRNGLEEAVAKR